MKTPFEPGAQMVYEHTVAPEDAAQFPEEGTVHPVYSTFALTRDVEWACRLFVLEMKEPGEEGVGSAVTVAHVSPAPVGANIRIVATLQSVEANIVRCQWKAYHGTRELAYGSQEQRIVDKAKFDNLISKVSANPNE